MLDKIIIRINADLDIIKASKNIRNQVSIFLESLTKEELNATKFFNQIKRNDSYEGLVSETMFFDDKFIYDVVIGKDNIDTHLVSINSINAIRLATIPTYITSKSADGKPLKSVSEHSTRLEIRYTDSGQLYYEVPSDRHDDILQLFNGLTKVSK